MSVTQNPAVREVLAQIVADPRYPDVTRVPVFSAFQIGLVVLAYGGCALGALGYLNGQLPLWVAMPLIAFSVYLSFTPLHDAVHRAASSNAFVNDLIGTVSGQLFVLGITTKAYRALHMDHHKYVGDKVLDPDEQLVIPGIGSAWKLAFIDVLWLHWYLTTAWNRWTPSLRKWILVVPVLNLAALVAAMMSPYWFEFLVLYFVPARLGMMFTGYCFATIQHPEGKSWNQEPFASTVTVVGHPLKRWIMLGQADHCLHHFVPHVPWYKYHRVWELANAVLRRMPIPERGMISGVHGIQGTATEVAEPAARYNVEVVASEAVARDVRSFVLRGSDAPLPAFDAGAHINLYLPSGSVRQYSLLGDPADRSGYRIAVKREENGRGGSREVHETLVPGARIEISAPRNNFVLYEQAATYILVAGGIGITPLLAMAYRLQALGKAFELHVCAQNREAVPFGDSLDRFPFADRIHVHLDAGGRSSLDPDALLSGPRADRMLYICGPAGFMSWIRDEAVRRNWNERMVRTESFSAPIPEKTENHPFVITLGRSQRRIDVPGDSTMLEALNKAGLEVPYACAQGTCGTCITPVLDGEVEHRDAYLSEAEKAENSAVCVCVSRARGKGITLDL